MWLSLCSSHARHSNCDMTARVKTVDLDQKYHCECVLTSRFYFTFVCVHDLLFPISLLVYTRKTASHWALFVHAVGTPNEGKVIHVVGTPFSLGTVIMAWIVDPNVT